MSKEMMIVFVYDTERCQSEADDPVAAVLYFHPSWVSDAQKISLVGQLMGTAHFVRDTFGSRPRSIALQSGRFVLKPFGRFLLAVGTDRNLPAGTLQLRADLLASLVRFFHRDIGTMHEQFDARTTAAGGEGGGGGGGGGGGQPYKSLSEKLYHVFETYLPILQHSGNVFQNMPISRLPKSASNIFLDAMQTLQSCQQTPGVLGGAIFFNNKVLATQLTPELTKNLILTDPYRIKSTAETLPVPYHIPVGVQLMAIYIPADDQRRLRGDAQRAQAVTNQSATTTTTATANGVGIIPFQFKKKIKRDKSIIFTNIPEEAPEPAAAAAITNGDDAPVHEQAVEASESHAAAAPPPPAARPAATGSGPQLVRPNHLPLRFKNITAKELPESGFSSINFDESDSFPQFIGRTSVCSTPMTEMKVLHGGAVVSICAATTAEPTVATQPPPTTTTTTTKTSTTNGAPIEEAVGGFRPAIRLQTRRHSLSNVQESLKKIRIAMRPFGHGLVKLGKTLRDRSPAPGIRDQAVSDGDDDDDDVNIDDLERTTYRTITDPMYPVFNSAGAPISRCLFQEFLLDGVAPPESTTTTTTTKSSNRSAPDQVDQVVPQTADDPLPLPGFDGTLLADSPSSPDDGAGTDAAELAAVLAGATSRLPARTPSSRAALSLPLKSLTLDLVDTTTTTTTATTSSSTLPPSAAQPARNGSIFEPPAARKKLAGIQLTPLMTKLSILAAADERSSGFSSWDTTPTAAPGAGALVSTPAGCERPFVRRRSSASRCGDDLAAFPEEAEEVDDEASEMEEMAASSAVAAAAAQTMERCELFVCGQQNMTMMLVLEREASGRPELVNAMFDTCVSRLARIESSLSQTLNVNVEGGGSDKAADAAVPNGGAASAAAAYSFLSTDPHWDTLQRGGPWSPADFLTLETMRSDLLADARKTDLVVRTDDAVIYGYQHGQSGVFYKQTAPLRPGLPPPADAMGTVAASAKRRLERDHSIILL